MQQRWSKLISREGVDITTISAIDPVFYSAINQFTKTHRELFFTEIRNKTFTHFIGVDAHELGRFLCQKFFNSRAKIEKYYLDGLAFGKQNFLLASHGSSMLDADPSSLLKVFRTFRRQFEKTCRVYSIYSFVAIEAWEKDFEEILSRMIARRDVSVHREKIMASLAKPWKKTAILELQDKMRKGVDKNKLLQEYQFLRSWAAVWHRPLSENWFQSISSASSRSSGGIYSMSQLVTLLKPNRKELAFLKLAPYIIFFKDWRDDLRRKQVYEWTFLFERIAKHFRVDSQDLGYCTLDELEEGFYKDKLDVECIRRRQSNAVLITVLPPHGKVKIWDRSIPKRYQDIIEKLQQSQNQTVIRGTIAQKGIVSGRVIILHSFHDIKRVQKGNILVANTTHPNYLPAMQQAAAFITNEGGLISHAAIVAREMKKPCITGTKIATKVLKDGDMVEVDAEKGVVRKI